MLPLDLRFAFRTLRRTPVVTAAAILTLALGIGANTAIFSVVSALLLRPLPYPEPARLVFVWETDLRQGGSLGIVSAPNYLDWQRQNHVFERMAIFEQLSYNLSGGREPEQVPALRVSGSIFPLLGIQPMLGRTFLPEEDELGRDRVVVLGNDLWRRRYAADPALVGKTIRINGEERTVVGVMPTGFQFPHHRFALWVPIAFNAEDRGRGSHSFQAVARLKPGVTMEQAKAEMDAIGRRLTRQYPQENVDESATVTPMRDFAVSEIRPVLFALLGAVGFVLLIACSNVANLLLARAASRKREFAVRTALGASRWRVIRQLLTESLLLAALGGVAGVLLAGWAMSLLTRILPNFIRFIPFRQMETIGLDWFVLGFALVVSVVTGILFGLAPALNASRAEVNEGLKDGGARGGTRGGRMRGVLVVAETAMAVVILVGAGLMIATVARLAGVDPGLNPKNLLTMDIALPQPDFYGDPQRTHFCQDVAERVGSVPGVRSASAVSHLPIVGGAAGRAFVIEGRPDPTAAENPNARYTLACPGFFQTMGIPLVRGRDFSFRDNLTAPNVVIVSETMMRRYWPNEDPVGRHIKFGNPRSESPWLTIVGVARDVHLFGLDSEFRPHMYRPYSQAAWPGMTIVARTAGDPANFTAAIRKAAGEIDREQPVSRILTMEQAIGESLSFRRFPMLLLATFALVALVLAAIGIYGVMAYTVTERTREIGIRMALGASARDVVRSVVLRSMVPVVIGVGAGLAGAALLTRLLTNLLYGVSPTDPAVLGGVSALLMLVSLAASLVPARKASRVDPIVALRYE